MVKVAIIGGGVNGLACGVKIKERFSKYDVVLISEEFTPNTTGDGSGGLWYPYLCGSTPEDLLTKWGSETYRFLHQLWIEGGYDVSLMPMYYLYKRQDEFRRPKWSNKVFGYRELERKQLDHLEKLHSSNYAAGETFTTFVVLPPSILKSLGGRFDAAGGRTVRGKVSSLRDRFLDGFDVVVNCSGLGARELVPDDSVFPIRGQIAKVSAPWLCYTIIDADRENYIIPNVETCILGGTHQENDYNTQVDEKDSDTIINGCQTIIPALKNSKLVRQWAGLRPGRREVRLESEERDNRLYIHNYGHGGSGMTLFWGCATDVLGLLEKHYYNKTPTETSKL